jgi:hypothetical protein
MEPEGSLPHSQVPANCPYPESARSSLGPYIPLSEDHSEYYPPIYAWVFQVFPSGFLAETLYTSFISPYVQHAQPISFFSILSPEQYLVRSAGHIIKIQAKK